MGTGLGPESYAIIEQGRIGQILSSKPSDRRAILEEAAGISKFKTRKRLAEAKLESSRQNLARVTDILLEVTKQMTSLKRQAGKARRYREISEELRGRLAVVLRSQLIAQQAECQRLGVQLPGIRLSAQRLRSGWKPSSVRKRSPVRADRDGLSQLRQSMAQRALDRERLRSRSEQIQELRRPRGAQRRRGGRN
jgi:chromosome segregation protein